jgi:hypothetical protein
MASTYVNDLRLNEMATGDASGSWGTVTNTNLELIGEAFSYGTETIGDADSTLTIADGAADAARSFYLKITSSVDLTTTRIVTLGPNTVSKVWMIENATTGSQVITIKQGSGATINVPNGQVKMISTDGAGSGGAVLDLLVDVDLTGTTTLVNLNVSGAVDIAGDLTLSAGGDGALRFTAASSVKVLDNNAAALVFEEADNAYMTFVTTDGSEAVKFDKALDINAATQIDATVTVGVDDTGYDVKFFGATAGKYMLWDESADTLEVSGTVVAAAGTALLPSITTTGDLNTGMWFPAADTIAFSEGGVEALRIDSSGNVGIGTSSPTGKLDLFSNVTSSTISTLTFSANNSVLAKKDYVQFVPDIQFNSATSEGGGYTLKVLQQGAYKNSIVAAGITNNSSNYLAFSTTSEAIRIISSGNVGIGTTSPSVTLHVKSANPVFGLETTGTVSAGGTVYSELKDSTGTVFTSGFAGLANCYQFSTIAAAGFMRFLTGAQVEALRIDSSGNVGIGTSSPAAKLHVEGTNAVMASTGLVTVQATTSGADVGGQITFQNNTARRAAIAGRQEASDAIAGYLQFGTRGTSGDITERMRIDSSGNVGIGVVPDAWSGTGAAIQLEGAGHLATANQYAYIGSNYYYNGGWKYTTSSTAAQYRQDSGTHQWLTAASGSADAAITWSESMRIDSSGNTMVGLTTAQARFTIGGAAATAANSTLCRIGNDSYGSDVVLSVAPGVVNFDAPGVVGGRMMIDSSGNLLVGTTTLVSPNPGHSFSVGNGSQQAIGHNGSSSGTYYSYYSYNGSVIGSITQSGITSVAYNTSSDYRLKTDAQPMTGASARVQALNPVNFEWIADGTRVDGFLAHEAQEVVPEAVTGEKDAVDADGNPEYQGIDQSKLVPLLTAALQEALTKIDALEARITALEG